MGNDCDEVIDDGCKDICQTCNSFPSSWFKDYSDDGDQCVCGASAHKIPAVIGVVAMGTPVAADPRVNV